jgi:hypothetical protein
LKHHHHDAAIAQLDLTQLAKPVRPSVDIPLEIEAKFLVPAGVARELAKNKESVQITTHYFSSDSIPWLIKRHRIRDTENDHHLLTTARLRMIKGDEVVYHLDFKGRKLNLGQGVVGRPELPPITLTRKEYREYRDRDTIGATVKQRYVIPGSVRLNSGVRHCFDANLDHYLYAGRELEKLPVDLYTIEFESTHAALVALKRGRHSFTFLESCLELNDENGELAGLLTNKRLAKKGYDKELRRCLGKRGEDCP